jgi:hypothetical protein
VPCWFVRVFMLGIHTASRLSISAEHDPRIRELLDSHPVRRILIAVVVFDAPEPIDMYNI